MSIRLNKFNKSLLSHPRTNDPRRESSHDVTDWSIGPDDEGMEKIRKMVEQSASQEAVVLRRVRYSVHGAQAGEFSHQDA